MTTGHAAPASAPPPAIRLDHRRADGVAPGAGLDAQENAQPVLGRGEGRCRMIVIDPLFRILFIVIDLYIWVVIISAILSWLVAFNVVNSYNKLIATVGEVLYRLTEPVLRPIRRILPTLGGVDLSPIVLILILIFAQMVLGNLHASLMGG